MSKLDRDWIFVDEEPEDTTIHDPFCFYSDEINKGMFDGDRCDDCERLSKARADERKQIHDFIKVAAAGDPKLLNTLTILLAYSGGEK